jgi:hypothetical protein
MCSDFKPIATFAIAFDKAETENRIRDMRDGKISDGSIREKYAIEDNRDWKLSDARTALQKRSSAEVSKNLVECAFRPFDKRSCFFGTEFMDYPRRELVDHVLGRSNLQLLISPQIGTASWHHSFVALEPAESCCISDGSTEQNYCFPLWLQGADSTTSENFSAAFRALLDTRYTHHYEPQEILGYIYAVLYAPT